MNMDITNTIMGRLEDFTNQMVQHQQQGDYDLVMLLDKEARELSTLMDGGEEMITLPQL